MRIFVVASFLFSAVFIAACSSGGDDGGGDSVAVYSAKDAGGKDISVSITKSAAASNSRYAPQTDDAYVLKYIGSAVSSGTISLSGTAITFNSAKGKTFTGVLGTKTVTFSAPIPTDTGSVSEIPIYVPVPVAVEGVTVSPATLSLVAQGTKGALKADISPANATNKNVTWYSSNDTVASVSSGSVTPLAGGTATISAVTVDGEFEGFCDITVTIPPGSGSVTFTFSGGPVDETITASTPAATLSKAAADTFTINVAGSYSAFAWYMDGAPVSGASASTLTVSAAALEVKKHTLTVKVTSAGVPYTKVITFAVGA